MVVRLVSQHCWFRNSFAKLRDRGGSNERCTAILFGTTQVMAVYAPDSSKDMDLYEAFVSSVLRVFRGKRRGGAKNSFTSLAT